MRSWYSKLFDRLNRYRISALLLIPIVAIRLLDPKGEVIALEPTRWVGRVAVLILAIAVALDWWDVYRGRRKIKRMVTVAQKISDGD